MKQTIIKFRILIALLFVFSCAKDDDLPAPIPPSIIGKWEYQKADTRDGAIVISVNSFDPLLNCVRNYLTFKSDNKVDYVNHSSPCTPELQTFNYTLNGTVLNYQSANKTIEKLTATEMVLTEPSGPIYITAYFFKKVP